MLLKYFLFFGGLAFSFLFAAKYNRLNGGHRVALSPRFLKFNLVTLSFQDIIKMQTFWEIKEWQKEN